MRTDRRQHNEDTWSIAQNKTERGKKSGQSVRMYEEMGKKTKVDGTGREGAREEDGGGDKK